MSRRAWAILALSAGLQLALSAVPATMSDLLEYRAWTRTLAREGLAAAYWPQGAADDGTFAPPVDYPPVVPYVLWGIGRGLRVVAPSALDRPCVLDFLIRLSFVACNLLLALFVYWEARRAASRASDLALALVALNPALVFDTVYWGQADAPWALFVVISVVALVRGRPGRAWAAMTAAALVKPLAYPFAPLLLLETLRRFAPRKVLLGAAALLAVLVLGGFLPFLWLGRGSDALRAIATQLDAMPYISVNAHNLWWLVGLGLPWTDAGGRPLGLFTWTSLSLGLLAALYLGVAALLLRSREPRSLYLAAATVGFGFFVLSTRMHENHLFCALPLLGLLAAESKPARTLLVVLTLAMLANLVLHDPLLTHWARPYTPGPHLLLPATLEPQVELQERFTRLGYPWIAEQLRGDTTVLGMGATLLNAQLVVLALLAWLAFLGRAGSLDAALRAPAWHPPRYAWAFAAAFAVATGLPFLAHVLDPRSERSAIPLRDVPRTNLAEPSGDPAHVGRPRNKPTGSRVDSLHLPVRESDEWDESYS